jgi:hypothetical protein
MLQMIDRPATAADSLVCNDIIATLNELGRYQIRGEYEEKATGLGIVRLQAVAKDEGVRINFTFIRNFYKVSIRIKAADRWIVFDSFNGLISKDKNPERHETDLKRLRSRAKAALHRPSGSEYMPAPWKFLNQRFTRVKLWHNAPSHIVRYMTQLAQARVVCLVRVLPNHKITRDDAAMPGADCWFLLDCNGHTGATYNIISDGEVFYPVRRISSEKSWEKACLARSSGKGSVELTSMGTIDKELVQEAIKVWVDATL